MKWYEEFYAALDNREEQAIEDSLTEDTTFRVGNHEEVVGRDAVMEATLHFFTIVGGMSHAFTNVVEEGDEALVEAIVTYTRLDGTTVDVPAGTYLKRRDGKVAIQRVYIDLQPVFAPSPEGSTSETSTARA